VNRIWFRLLIALTAVASLSYAGAINMQICYSVAPNAYGSPSWGGYVSNAIQGLENGCSSEGSPTSPSYYSTASSISAADVTVATQEIRIAQVRVNLVKQRQLVRIGKAPFASLAAFERTIDEQEAKGKQTRASSLDLRTKAQGLLDLWKAAQAEYATQTGDFDSGIWLE